MTLISPSGPRLACLLALLLPVQFLPLTQCRAALTLAYAEQFALDADPAVSAAELQALALRDQAVADGQLPDPKLLLGVWNLPTDDFSMRKEASSQLRAGIRQAFPRGDSLKYRRGRTQWLSRAESAATQEVRAAIRRAVRRSFLELYYQERAAEIIRHNRSLFDQLVEITRAHYASGRVSQQDVLQAQLELSRLDDRATRIDEQRDVQRATLSRWLGDAAWQPVSPQFPSLPEVPSLAVLQAGLGSHPSIKAAGARVQASQQRVREAREQYKPGFDVGVEYRKRFGNDSDGGGDRPDQLAAMVTLDLPLFPDKRQDRRLAASQQRAGAAIQQRERRLRELQRDLARDYARWQRLGEQQTLYREQLLREAADNALSAVTAYQSGTTDFTALLRARITELDIRLQDLRIRVDRARTLADLLYLLPTTQTTAAVGGEEQP